MIQKIASRLGVYLSEFAHCLRIGVTLRDKLLLLRETVWFHLHHNRPGLVLEARVKIGKLHPLLRMRRYGGDTFIFHEVLRCGVYDFPESRLGAKPQVVVDLGANIGLATLSIVSRFPGARAVCVEPHPENAQLLRHNLQCLGDRAMVIEAAVSDHSGYMDLAMAAEHYNASLVRGGSEIVRVKALTMEEVMSEAGITTIDVLKMDIEGAELALLENRPQWLEKVRLILAELHGPRQKEMIGWISEAGFEVRCDGSQITAWRKCG
ncbi:MAG: FkbM family methyltransferase [Verrucomicrobiota bacterium]